MEEEGFMRVGDYLKYLKTRWNRKQGRRNKDFKKEGANWVKGLKIGEGGWNPLTN